MFKTDILCNKKLSLNQNVRHDHVTMQQDIFAFLIVVFYTEIRPMKVFRFAFVDFTEDF